jgi:hypothetical protein
MSADAFSPRLVKAADAAELASDEEEGVSLGDDILSNTNYYTNAII